ncbi:hypothetical protein Tco_0356925 [Tanacetum coccineum]
MLTGEACTLFPSLRTNAKELLADPEFVPLGIKALVKSGSTKLVLNSNSYLRDILGDILGKDMYYPLTFVKPIRVSLVYKRNPKAQCYDVSHIVDLDLSKLSIVLQRLVRSYTKDLQTASSSSCERNWSVFERIHMKMRNRLKVDKRSYDLIDYECIDDKDFWVVEKEPQGELDYDELETMLDDEDEEPPSQT